MVCHGCRRNAHHDPGRGGSSLWSAPRATDDEFDGLLARLRQEGVEECPPILGLSGSLRAALMYMRQDIVQAVIGERLGVSQPTVSRAIKAITAAISRTLAVLLLTAEEVPEDCDCRGGRHPHPLPGLARPPRSVVGQAQTRGHERPGSWSGPTEGSCGPRGPLSGVHARCGRTRRLRTAGGNGPLRVDRRQGIRGKRDDHPAQEAPNGELSEAAKEENKSVNRIRQVVERTIAHIKSWRIHPHCLQETPGNIRADDHRSTRILHLQNHPLNNLP